MKRVAKKPTGKKSRRGAAAKKSVKPASAGDGDAQVKAYLRGLPAWQRDIAQRFDDLLVREVPALQRCIKWGMPFYGVAGNGWFVSCGGFPKCVKVTFFQGTKLTPVPPAGTSRQTRSLDVRNLGELDAAPMASWVRQALKLPGFAS